MNARFLDCLVEHIRFRGRWRWGMLAFIWIVAISGIA